MIYFEPRLGISAVVKSACSVPSHGLAVVNYGNNIANASGSLLVPLRAAGRIGQSW